MNQKINANFLARIILFYKKIEVWKRGGEANDFM